MFVVFCIRLHLVTLLVCDASCLQRPPATWITDPGCAPWMTCWSASSSARRRSPALTSQVGRLLPCPLLKLGNRVPQTAFLKPRSSNRDVPQAAAFLKPSRAVCSVFFKHPKLSNPPLSVRSILPTIWHPIDLILVSL